VQIVTNADDFGASAETVAATVACFEQRALTSATIMVAMPETAAALAFAATHREHGFGVHLQLVGDGAERPVSSPAEIPGLVDADGFLLPTGLVRKRALLGRLSVDELQREIEAQIDVATSYGLEPTHVDSHRHLHKLGQVREALRRALPRFGLRRVRRVQDVFLRRPLGAPTYWVGPWWQRGLARSFATTDRFYMPSSAHDVAWDQALLDRLDHLAAGTIEVGVHPGTAEDWRADEGASVVRFSAGARERGHTLVSWAQIPDG
jgi:predicted glycoside hydrolase/deacetylase ChbG (UPF0249 family)